MFDGLNNQMVAGQLPASLGNITTLREIRIYAQGSVITGGIPDAWAGLSLTELTLSHNCLSGTLPNWLGSMTTLTSLTLQHCAGCSSGAEAGCSGFSGIIPASFNSLVNLQSMCVRA
jgi:hypothetical protein